MPGKDFQVEVKASRAKPSARGLPSIRRSELPDDLKRMIDDVAQEVPSSRVEILPPEPTTAEQYAHEISRLWQDAQHYFFKIGELLDRAKGTLPAEEYNRLVEQLPFDPSARTQLMTAYRAIQSGRVPEDMKSAGYSTVYQLASLTDDELRQAGHERLLQPGITRNKVIQFKRRIKESGSGTDIRLRRARLEAERKRLISEMERIRFRLNQIEVELGTLREDV